MSEEVRTTDERVATLEAEVRDLRTYLATLVGLVTELNNQSSIGRRSHDNMVVDQKLRELERAIDS